MPCSTICSPGRPRASCNSAKWLAATPTSTNTDLKSMAKITMLEAITRAHAWEMSHDDSVIVLGEDVGVNGGVFRATAGLQEQFGKDRVMDTPLAEALIAGISIGMAAQGMKPVAEFQFSGFIYPT